LNAAGGAELDEAWAEFVAAYTGIVMHTGIAVLRDRDAAMDGYARVLEALREDRCRRLRAYVPDSRTPFTTWLIVVARRILLDYHRHRYGRPRSGDDARRAELAARRRLEDLVAELDPDQLTSSAASSPDAPLRRRELSYALRSALGELDSSDRQLLALRFGDDRPVREIAAVLGVPTFFGVYRRLDAALGVLRGALAQRGVEEPDP
jgi:RNA polymerase sigma factor (sigma-70 family)